MGTRLQPFAWAGMLGWLHRRFPPCPARRLHHRDGDIGRALKSDGVNPGWLWGHLWDAVGSVQGPFGVAFLALHSP